MRKIIITALALLCAACSNNVTTSVQATETIADSGSRADTRQEVSSRGWIDMSPEGIAARKAAK